MSVCLDLSSLGFLFLFFFFFFFFCSFRWLCFGFSFLLFEKVWDVLTLPRLWWLEVRSTTTDIPQTYVCQLQRGFRGKSLLKTLKYSVERNGGNSLGKNALGSPPPAPPQLSKDGCPLHSIAADFSQFSGQRCCFPEAILAARPSVQV